jgi:acyl-coenzyme A synthetase/AMP-(fatty) acid ligase
VLFTSGATGPAKGVRYTHGQLAAQRDALASTYAITDSDRLVAAFAPFALYGPALGIPTALPDVDVTKPGELTADALDSACTRIGATLAFASPAALANVVATAQPGARHAGLAGLRVVFSAGAPVPSETLRAVGALAPDASLHTPYGMTEVLPVADIELAAIEQAELDDPTGGVCVGHPVDGAEVRIAALGFDAEDVPPELDTGTTGEILVRAPWVSAGYLGLWATQRDARPGAVGDWHRSGDVGHLDALGRLWVEGRAVHVIHGPDGPITSVPVERVVERSLGLRRVAAVGVGPVGGQQLVVVIEDPSADEGPADSGVAAAVRTAVGKPVASVLTVPELPVDIRHNAKIDRAQVASWASDVLAGRSAKRLMRRW